MTTQTNIIESDKMRLRDLKFWLKAWEVRLKIALVKMVRNSPFPDLVRILSPRTRM